MNIKLKRSSNRQNANYWELFVKLLESVPPSALLTHNSLLLAVQDVFVCYLQTTPTERTAETRALLRHVSRVFALLCGKFASVFRPSLDSYVVFIVALSEDLQGQKRKKIFFFIIIITNRGNFFSANSYNIYTYRYIPGTYMQLYIHVYNNKLHVVCVCVCLLLCVSDGSLDDMAKIFMKKLLLALRRELSRSLNRKRIFQVLVKLKKKKSFFYFYIFGYGVFFPLPMFNLIKYYNLRGWVFFLAPPPVPL